jgi:hypothetical protein
LSNSGRFTQVGARAAKPFTITSVVISPAASVWITDRKVFRAGMNFGAIGEGVHRLETDPEAPDGG